MANSGYANSSGLQGDLTYRSGVSNEIIHFTAASQHMFGERYHLAYQQALLNHADHVDTAPSSPSSSSTTPAGHTPHSAVFAFATAAVATIVVLAVLCCAALTPVVSGDSEDVWQVPQATSRREKKGLLQFAGV